MQLKGKKFQSKGDFFRTKDFQLQKKELKRRESLVAVAIKNKGSDHQIVPSCLCLKDGGYLLFHCYAVPSTLSGLTSLFGMGRGGSPTLLPP